MLNRFLLEKLEKIEAISFLHTEKDFIFIEESRRILKEAKMINKVNKINIEYFSNLILETTNIIETCEAIRPYNSYRFQNGLIQ